MKNGIQFFTLLLFLTCLSVSCTQTEQGTSQTANHYEVPDSLKNILQERVNTYYIDMSRRDWDVYSAHFWPGAYLATVWQPPGSDSIQVVMTTIEEFVAQADQGPGSQPIFEEKMLDAEIKLYNNLATVWATYAAKFGTEDSLMEWEGIDAFTYLNHNGEWRIVSLAYTQMEEQ